MELKLTQKELIATEKLASLGQLSAGVAHEIGNPLSAIKVYSEVLKRALDIDNEKREGIINDILREVGRVDRIIRTLLDYARPRKSSLQIVNINQVIKDTAELVRSQGVLKNIPLTLDLAEEMPSVIADPGQLSQVIINLVLNSRDALRDPGEIVISTACGGESEVVISVKDNGAGIPKEIKIGRASCRERV